MSKSELQAQIAEGVQFWKYSSGDHILGVMGIQFKGDVTLIRHAYIRSTERKKGLGGELLKFLCEKIETPVLIGTWESATWAIKFYQKHAFRLLPDDQKVALLKKYWNIPDRQIETSVVLGNDRYLCIFKH